MLLSFKALSRRRGTFIIVENSCAVRTRIVFFDLTLPLTLKILFFIIFGELQYQPSSINSISSCFQLDCNSRSKVAIDFCLYNFIIDPDLFLHEPVYKDSVIRFLL